MFVLVITGPPGAGKSEVGSALHDSLGDAGEDAAMIEVDALEPAALRASAPPLHRRRAMDHLASLAGSYRDLGTETLIVTATIEDDDYRVAVVDAVGGGPVMVVRLEADPETMRDRILAREPPGWGGLPELLNASRRLAEEIKALDGVDLVLSTEGRQPGEVAGELERALRERSAGR